MSLRARRLSASIAVLALLALLLASCSGDGGPPGPVGFLPAWTPAPTATDAPGTLNGPFGKCPPRARFMCLTPGDTSNLYRDFQMARVESLRVSRRGSERWVLGRDRVQAILRLLDREVVLEAFSPDPFNVTPGAFGLTLVWSPGRGMRLDDPATLDGPPWGASATLDELALGVDPESGMISEAIVGIQGRLPQGFAELLVASLSSAKPTPVTHDTPTPTATIVPPGTVRFFHPEGELVWDGPDDQVASEPEALRQPAAPR